MSKSARAYKADLDALDAEIDQMRQKRAALWLDYCEAAYRESVWASDRQKTLRQKQGQLVRAAWARLTPIERAAREAKRMNTRRERSAAGQGGRL